MNSRRFILSVFVVLSLAGFAFAAAKTYKYKCNKCKLIQEYGTPGVKRCPNDGSIMIRQN